MFFDVFNKMEGLRYILKAYYLGFIAFNDPQREIFAFSKNGVYLEMGVVFWMMVALNRLDIFWWKASLSF